MMLGKFREVVITAITDEAYNIRSYHLESADGVQLEMAPAGAHIDLHMPGGLTRQYSLCHNPSAVDAYVIAVKNEATSRGARCYCGGDHAACASKHSTDLEAPGSQLQAATPT